MTFDSAEGLTRFLRGKNAGPEEIALSIRALFAGEYPVYLPNSSQFVFELICDRMNDFNGKFASWKLHADFWDLWAETWKGFVDSELDKEVRAKIFRRVKLITIVSSVLDDVFPITQKEASPKVKKNTNKKSPASSKLKKDTNRKGPELPSASSPKRLLSSMFACLKLFASSGYINIDEFAAVSLLASYSRAFVKLEDSAELDGTLANEWTSLIGELYDLPHQSVSYKPSKKGTAKYFSEVLPVKLSILGLRRRADYGECYGIFKRIFHAALFGPHQSALASNIELLMKSENEALNEVGVRFLYEEVISQLAAKDIALCEAIFEVITKDEFAYLAEHLLELLSKVNRTLSSSFLARIYDAETTKQKPNWRLVAYIVNLDPELALSKWENIVDASAGFSKEATVFLATNIAQGFIRGRDYSLFLLTVYPHALTKNDFWASEEVAEALSSKVNELSGNQILALLKRFLAEKAKSTLSLILRGLLGCPSSKQKQSQSLFEGDSFCESGWAQIAYYVLCIYGRSVSEAHPDLVEKVVPKNSEKTNKFDTYLAFRVAELTGNIDRVNIELVRGYIESLTSALDFIEFFGRWCVILSEISDLHQCLIGKFLSLLSANKVLEFLQSEHSVFYELLPMLTSLLAYLTKNKISYAYEIFQILPPVVFRKYFGGFLSQICKGIEEHPNNVSARKALRHILEQPTLSSAIEKDFSLLRTLIASTIEKGHDDSVAIARSVWHAHVVNFKSSSSSAYILDAIHSLHKALSIASPGPADLALARIAITERISSLEQEQLQLLGLYVKVFEDSPPKHLESYLRDLTELPLENLDTKVRTSLKRIVKKYGAEDISVECKRLLFVLVTKISTEESAEYVVSLFMALNCTNELVLKNLEHFLRKLSNGSFASVYKLVIGSLESAPAEFASLLVEVLTLLAPLTDKQYQEEHTSIFVSSLLTVLGRVPDLIKYGQDALVRHMTTLTAMLSNHVWVFKQFGVEMILSFTNTVITNIECAASAEEVYLAALGMCSYVVLFHRFRLSSRYHLVIAVLSNILKPLSAHGVLSDSARCGAAYSRLITGLCEPPTQASTKMNEALTSQAALYKKAFRRHAHMLLVNYIHLHLTESFTSDLNEALMPGIHSIFTLLSRVELQLASHCLDSLGKVFFKSLYNGYNEHGKWRNS